MLLADDHDEIIERVKRLLESEFDVIATATDGERAVARTLELRPDVAVFDITMPRVNGLEAARMVRDRVSTRIVFLTVHEDPVLIEAALDAGALGYVSKTRLGLDLAHAVREALVGRRFISPNVQLARGSPASHFRAP